MPGRRQPEAFLEGTLVLDMTEALAGPYCAAILSDLGAEVIKIERTNGDAMRRRRVGPGDVSYPFEMVQRNKRSVAVDISDPAGADIVRGLAGHADVLLENFRPGAMAKRGLAYDDLKHDAPSLVYCSISGFGQTGPRRNAKGVDLIAQGYAGLLSVTGHEESGPAKAGYPVSDLGAGMWGAIGILGALARRSRTGEGAYVDVSLADGLLAWGVWEFADYQMSGEIPGRLGTAHRLVAPYQAFRCAEGDWLTVAAVGSRWQEFCEVVGHPELAADPRYDAEYKRFQRRAELEDVLIDAFATADRDTWITRLNEVGVPCGPVQDMAEVADDPQFTAREMFVGQDVGGTSVTYLNSPVRSDGVPGVIDRAPGIGTDTADVLGSLLGLDPGAIGSLEERGIIGTGRQ